MKPYCCNDFIGYTHEKSAGFEYDSNGTWNVYGCCHGGCYVITDVKYCPFCGAYIGDGEPNNVRGNNP